MNKKHQRTATSSVRNKNLIMEALLELRQRDVYAIAIHENY